MIYFITGNENKLKEAQTIIPEIEGVYIDLKEIQEIDSKKIIEEKLKEASKCGYERFFIEDTSLEIECLNGFPGPLIKWMLESVGDRGIAEIVHKYENHDVYAKTHIGYSNKNKIVFFEGCVKGKIVIPKIKTPFGWDGIFQPDGYDYTYSEMKDEKNNISPRKIALEKLKIHLLKESDLEERI